MSERKFQDGDRVRVVRSDWAYTSSVGKTGTARKYEDSPTRKIWVEFDDGGRDSALHSDCELLVESARTITLDGIEYDLVPRPVPAPYVFKAGDWAVLLEGQLGIPNGGDVLLITGPSGGSVTVTHPKINDGSGWESVRLDNLRPSDRPRIEF